MPFELKQAPRWFQLLMNDVLRPLIGKIIVIYLDDIVVYTKGSLEQHVKDVEEVLKLIEQATLQIKIKKCVFFNKKSIS